MASYFSLSGCEPIKHTHDGEGERVVRACDCALRQSRIGSRPAASTGSRRSQLAPLRSLRRRAQAAATHPSRPRHSRSSARAKGLLLCKQLICALRVTSKGKGAD